MKTNVYLVTAALAVEVEGQPQHCPLAPINIEADTPEDALVNAKQYFEAIEPRVAQEGAVLRFLGGASLVATGVVVVDATAQPQAGGDPTVAGKKLHDAEILLASKTAALEDLQGQFAASEAASLAKDTLIADLEAQVKTLTPPKVADQTTNKAEGEDASLEHAAVEPSAAGEQGSAAIPGVSA